MQKRYLFVRFVPFVCGVVLHEKKMFICYTTLGFPDHPCFREQASKQVCLVFDADYFTRNLELFFFQRPCGTYPPSSRRVEFFYESILIFSCAGRE